MRQSPFMLVVLDGFGCAPPAEDNAVTQAQMPFFDMLRAQGSYATLAASGAAVGLPPGYIGNSEVGHLTMGSGRVVKQPITRLFDLIDSGRLLRSPVIGELFRSVRASDGRLHILGLLSDAGVHAHERHIHALIELASTQGISVVVHPFLDGRDVPPRSAQEYLARLDLIVDRCGGIIGSMHGRFYAMDRDGNAERTRQSYEMLVQPQEPCVSSWRDALAESYAQNVTDEFFVPVRLHEDAYIRNGDGIFFANVRPDRARQLTEMICSSSIRLCSFVTAASYGKYEGVTPLLEQEVVAPVLKSVLVEAGKRIFTIAETEKYAHVTYFFDGGREEPFENEARVLVPSIPAQTYVGHPCMQAPEITDRILTSLRNDPHDFYLINYANADMVGHSGDLQATVAALECLDEQIGKLYEQCVVRMGGTVCVTADHGNAEDMYNEARSQPCTSHTANPVPFVCVHGQGCCQGSPKELADIASYVLRCMGVAVPEAMQR